MSEWEAEYRLALKGREYWLELKEKYEINENSCLVICPSEDRDLNRIAIENLFAFLDRKYLRCAVVISVSPAMEKQAVSVGGKSVIFVQTDYKKIEGILKYYRLIQFTKNIIVVSLEQPFGNDGLIGKKGITLEDYVNNAIYV